MWEKFFFTEEMAKEATEKFEKLDGFLKHYNDTSLVGVHHWIFRFGDGAHSHGASIIAGPGTCTCVGHPFELAVVFFPYEKNESNEYDLDYDTEITDDVVGCNTFEEIVELLDRIKNLDSYDEKEWLPQYEGKWMTESENSKTGWIPVSEKLPEDGEWAIFTDGNLMSIERYKMDALDHFYPEGRYFDLEAVVAWMPLPKPYKTESEEAK